MYDKCQGYNSKIPHIATTPVYMPKHQLDTSQNQIKHDLSTPTTPNPPSTSVSMTQQNIPDSTLQTICSNYLQSFSPSQQRSSLFNDSNDTLKLHKFYQIIPFKCPFCFTFKEAAGEFIEHLTVKHYLDVKLGYDKLQLLTNNRLFNGVSAFKIGNKKDDYGDVSCNGNKNDYEPLAKRFLYSIKNTVDMNNNDSLFSQHQKIQDDQKNKNDVDIEDEDEEDDSANCTSSCCNANGDDQQQQQSENDLDYQNHNNRLLQNNNGNKIFNVKSKCLTSIDNRFSNNHRIDFMPPKINSNRNDALISPSPINKPQQQMLNLTYLMSSVSSMHCAICNRGFEYYSNLRRHIKTKHKIFGKEVKEYVIRHNNNNSQYQRSQSQQHLQMNSIKSNSIISNRSSTSSPIVNLNSKNENSIKYSPNGFDNDHENNNNNNDEGSEKRIANDEGDNNKNNKKSDSVESAQEAQGNKQLSRNDNNNIEKSNNKQQNENLAIQTPPGTVNHQQSCTSPLSTVSSHSSIYSSVSPNSISPSRSYSPPTTSSVQQTQQIFSNMSSCMSTKFKTSLLETLLTRKLPLQSKTPCDNSTTSSTAATTPTPPTTTTTSTTATTTTVSSSVTPNPIATSSTPTKIEPSNFMPTTPTLNDSISLDSTPTTSPHLSFYQLAQQQHLQQLLLQNNLASFNDINNMNNFKKFFRNFAKTSNFSYAQFEGCTNPNSTAFGNNNFSNLNFKNSFTNSDDKQQSYLQQHSQDSNDNRTRFHLNTTSQDDPCDDEYQSNHEDYEDIENSNCSSFNNNDSINKKVLINSSNSQLPTSTGANSSQDLPLNMNVKNNNFNSNIKFENNQVRYSTEIWRCPYCCYETTSASRYNSHLVSILRYYLDKN